MNIRVKNLLLWLVPISLLTLSAFGQRKMTLTYDRIQFAEDFLNAIYPGLGPHRLITVQTGFGWIGSTFFYVGITPCSLADSVVSSLNNRAQGAPKACPAPLQVDASSFFMASIILSHRKPYLRGYGASGEFLSGKLEAWHRELIRHIEWTEGQRLNALRLMNPRFGPDEKEAFVNTIPVQTIQQLSGCRLNPGSATFLAKRLLPPPDTGMQLGWTVYGRSWDKLHGCSAEFEPFQGRLLRLDSGLM